MSSSLGTFVAEPSRVERAGVTPPDQAERAA
jgi:hypothetical protein